MSRLLFCIVLVGFVCNFVSGQNENFEYECDILQRLESLENQLKKAKDENNASLEELEAKLKKTEDDNVASLEELEAKLKKTEADNVASLEELEAKLKKIEEENAASLKELEAKLSKTEEENAVLTKQIQEQSATTYVRWGRSSCPSNGSETIYSGIAGGSYFDDHGAAVDMLCLPNEPTYGDYYEDSVQSPGGQIMGVEYRLEGRQNMTLFFPDIDLDSPLTYKNMPCAVCRVSRPTMLMLPAQNKCQDGWTLEYKGMLASGFFGNAAATEYFCLDDQPEVIPGGDADDTYVKAVHFVEAICFGLPCPPYVGGRELTCAVCTK